MDTNQDKPPDLPRKTFANVVAGTTSKKKIEKKKISVFKGEPAVFFSKEEIQILAEPFKFALVGKFPRGRPSMESIRSVFAKLNLKADYKIGLIDSNHILIHLNNEDDYHRIWLRTQWNIYQYAMIVTKWHVNFTPDNESPILPVWVNMPYLPAHLFDEDAIESIARIVGQPMRVDLATTTLSRPSKARVCVEVDITRDLPSRGWVGQGDTGFWQTFEYEEIPHYCTKCMKVGHQNINCIVYTQDKNKEKNEQHITENTSAQNKAGNKAQNNYNNGKTKQIYILKRGETMQETTKVNVEVPASEQQNINREKGTTDKEISTSDKEKETPEDIDTDKEKGTPDVAATDKGNMNQDTDIEEINSPFEESSANMVSRTPKIAKTTDDIPENNTSVHKTGSVHTYATDNEKEIAQNKSKEKTGEEQDKEEDMIYSENSEDISDYSKEQEDISQVQDTQFQLVTKRKKKTYQKP